MAAPQRHCSEPMCPGWATHRGRCETHYRAADAQRGTAASRGYNSRRHRAARKTVLKRDPFCTCISDDTRHHHPPGGPCPRVSTVADHYPKSRKELLADGSDPDDATRMRGLCAGCHSRETGVRQPGGWNERA